MLQFYLLLSKESNHSYHLEEDESSRINRITGYLENKEKNKVKHGIDLRIFWEQSQIEFTVYKNGSPKRFFLETQRHP